MTALFCVSCTGIVTKFIIHIPYGEGLDYKRFNRKDRLALNRECNSTIEVKERWHEILTYNTLVDVVACWACST